MQRADDFPDGLPTRIEGPGAWYGPDLAQRRDWIETLSPAELDELAAAARPWLARVEHDSHALNQLTPANFPLSTLAARAARVTEELLHGRGFVLLRGVPVAEWGNRLSAVAFYGFGVHIGNPRTQNAQGHLLGHVRDLGLRSDDPNVRIYQTHERQTFHTDSADVVGLLCLQTAKAGGLSALVSSITLYNEMRARRPDLARRLFVPFATDRRGEVPPGQKPYFTIPVFNWYAGELSAIYQRQYIDSAQRFADAPRLASEDVEALDLLDALTDEPALHLTMPLERGDMQFVHNHTLLHDRTAFEDYEAPERRRHLLRLWLAPADARPLPPVFAQRYGSVVAGARGGVGVAEHAGVMPLPDEWLVADNIRAVGVIYSICMLEQARLFAVVDKIVELFMSGMMPLGRGNAGTLVSQWWSRRSDRLTDAERRDLYSRVLGMPGGDPGGTPNREFNDLWIRFVSAVSERSARNLAANLSAHGYGATAFAARELNGSLKDAIAILSDHDIAAAFGVRDMWQVIDRVSTQYLGGAVNAHRYRTLAQSGTKIIDWLADSSDAFNRGECPHDFTVVANACEQWLVARATDSDS